MESELEALEFTYNDKDENDNCEGFLYIRVDVNLKLVEEYVREK